MLAGGDLKLMRSAVTGKHAMALAALAEGAAPGAVLTPAIGEERMGLGRNGIDFVSGPVSHVAMTGSSLSHAEVAHFLISKGADPTLYSAEVNTNVDFAPGIMYTIGYEIFPNSSRAALLQKLVTSFPTQFDMRRVRSWALSTGNSLAMQCAVEANFYDGVYVLVTMQRLVPRFEYDINEKDARGRTALMIAASFGQVEIVRLLIHNSAKITLRDSQKRTALHHAAMGGHIGVIETIISARKEVEVLRKMIQLKDVDGRTALGLASMTPVRLPVVRALRTMMAPLGVVPHTAPWLAKPFIHDSYRARNISRWVADYSERVASQLGSTDQISKWRTGMNDLTNVLNNTSESGIDCIDISGQWTDELKRKIYRDYVSPKRPFLASTVSITSAVSPSASLFADTHTVLASLGDWRQQNGSVSLMSVNNLTCVSDSAECTLAKDTGGKFKPLLFDTHGDDTVTFNIAGDVISRENTPVFNIDASQIVLHPFENIYMGGARRSGQLLTEVVDDGMYAMFAGDWCERALSHPKNYGAITVGSAGGVMKGFVPLYSHFHNKLLSGAKMWFLFPAAVNSTAKTEIVDKAIKKLSSTGFNPYRVVTEIVPAMKESLDVHSVVQYRGDIIYIPTGWSYMTLNLVPVVSAVWQTCMLDLSRPNCESHSIIRPVSE